MENPGGKTVEPATSWPLLLFNAAIFFFWFSNHLPSPILPLYVLEVTDQVQMAGLVVGAYGLSQMLVRIPLGFLSDWLGDRKRLTLSGAFCASAGCIGFLLSTHPALMFASRLLAGIGASFYVVFAVWYVSFFPPAMSSRAMGKLVFWGSLSQVLATLSSGWMTQELGWLAPFQIGAVAGLCAFLCWFGVPNERAFHGRRVHLKEVTSIAFSWRLQKVSFMGALVMFASFATIYTVLPVQAESIGASRVDQGVLMSLNLLAYCGAAFFMGSRALARFSIQGILRWGLLASGLCILAMPLMPTLGSLYIPVAVHGLGRGLSYTALMSYAVTPYSSDQKGMAMGVFQAVYALGMMMGPFAAGWIAQGVGIPWVFAVAGLANLAALLASQRLAVSS